MHCSDQSMIRAIVARFFASVLMSFLLVLGSRAQGELVERQVKASPGKDVRVGVFLNIRQDCTSGPLPAIRLLAPPAHGTVSVKRATFKATNFKQCLATEVPAFVAFYRAAMDFSGADTFDLEVTAVGGRKQIERFQVSVSDSASGQQGI